MVFPELLAKPASRNEIIDNGLYNLETDKVKENLTVPHVVIIYFEHVYIGSIVAYNVDCILLHYQ